MEGKRPGRKVPRSFSKATQKAPDLVLDSIGSAKHHSRSSVKLFLLKWKALKRKAAGTIGRLKLTKEDCGIDQRHQKGLYIATVFKYGYTGLNTRGDVVRPTIHVSMLDH